MYTAAAATCDKFCVSLPSAAAACSNLMRMTHCGGIAAVALLYAEWGDKAALGATVCTVYIWQHVGLSGAAGSADCHHQGMISASIPSYCLQTLPFLLPLV